MKSTTSDVETASLKPIICSQL